MLFWSVCAAVLLNAAGAISIRSPLPSMCPTPDSYTNPEHPRIHLSYGSYEGVMEGNTHRFYGMHYAAPPVGPLRFSPPKPPIPFPGLKDASRFGAACPQQSVLPGFPPNGKDTFTNQSEDCLFVNVIKPAYIPSKQKLPVLVWIYGGGFMLGDTSSYDGTPIVERSMTLGTPVIYVSINYRMSAYGFLPGKEAKEAGIGNIGILDQVAGLEWVQKHIYRFGGDSNKVILWGESAGASSVGLHLVRNDGDTKGLFHGAFMQSGSPVPFGDIERGQPQFDKLVEDTGCSDAADKIDCLRSVPHDQLQSVITKAPNLLGYHSLKLPFGPTIDGKVLVRNPQVSLIKGLYAKVPIVSGACDDEATIFSFGSQNVTTDAEFKEFLRGYLPVTQDKIDMIAALYPEDPTAGSPFGTGSANALTPQFKRIAAFHGDWRFHAARRFFVSRVSKTQPTWSFLWKRGKALPYVGAAHTYEIPEFFASGNNPDYIGTDALISFANILNPSTSNTHSLLSKYNWEQYGVSSTDPPVLTFVDPGSAITTTYDTYRADGIAYLAELNFQLATGLSLNLASQPT
ncbi:carotenoid ester lipase [Coprinopsis cinerea okayama7|uniref:Carboxylic ester hydrolase n=1 Tax=Coprinopsis cinerea (strain Okayama-7 / 130 / ATCC MYA-4618 / FGSC 9003) TaxID=240176 RepID=A8PAG3_COPC7|nr:carotenoid ester lipase [Coprinopsis cinerea okayama7\|eukprot:XP_001839982.2 carotenoid ester lipase [Coprinopsis cinerea okayama7\